MGHLFSLLANVLAYCIIISTHTLCKNSRRTYTRWKFMIVIILDNEQEEESNDWLYYVIADIIKRQNDIIENLYSMMENDTWERREGGG